LSPEEAYQRAVAMATGASGTPTIDPDTGEVIKITAEDLDE